MHAPLGNRAIVLGGSMGGLLAARVLSDQFREVIVVDRDQLDEAGRDPRPSVPQGRHAHGLVARGQQILQQLFPDLTEELTAAGITPGDFGADIDWYFNGRLLSTEPTGLLSVPATRPVLEYHVRKRVLAIDNVVFRQRHDIVELCTDPSRGRVTGVRVQARGDDGQREELTADLVVDSTGRGSRMPTWLESMGYPRPLQERIKMGLAYTTAHFELDHDPFGDKIAIIVVATPDFPRGALLYRLPGHTDRVELSLTGVLGDHPPVDPEAFLEFARSLPVPHIYQAVRSAKPLDRPVMHQFPASVRNRYEDLSSFPAGLLVLGDAVCSFNPVYGQGMTVAALEAMTLGRLLAEGTVPSGQTFFRAISTDIDNPWQFAAGADLGYAGVEGPRTPKVRFANAYVARLHAGAVSDPRLTTAFIRAAGLVDSPAALMRPATAWRVLRAGRRGRSATPATAPPAINSV